MSTDVLSPSENYEIFRTEVTENTTELADFNEGSMLDAIAGAISTGQNEVAELVITEFMKTYFSTAPGPTTEDPTDYLNDLAVDRFGDTFARPEASKSTGTVTFQRPTNDAGDVTIAIGTIIKTVKSSSGVEIRFQTTEAKVLTGLTVDANIEAMVAGSSGQVGADKITVIESTLTDASITVTNASATAGGEDAPNDEEYREIIKNLILALAGATDAAVKGAALAVPGVAFADLVTLNMPVIEWDINTMAPKVGESYFRIPYPVIYVADEDGNSSADLIAAVVLAIRSVRACGVKIQVLGATGVEIDWTGSYTLNPSGPNYAELSADPTKIIDTMTEYINQLAIGDDFIRADANAYILSVWGPAGTDDLTAFTSSLPVGDVSIDANEKTVAGSINIV